ncbi:MULTISPECIES: glycosyltransferase [unclassified Vibrio]|uniref:glycosyltransferase n=1 Tax=unclassified Vibrio TaxID=2614977 RepID=UPI0035531319
MSNENKIVILAPSLNTGGISKVINSYYRMFCNNKVECNIVLTDNILTDRSENIPLSKITTLGFKTSKYYKKNFFDLFRNILLLPLSVGKLTRRNEKTIICVHFLPIFIGILLKFFKPSLNCLFVYHTNVFTYSQGKSKLVSFLYEKFIWVSQIGDSVVFLTEDVTNEFNKKTGLGKAVTIPNCYERICCIEKKDYAEHCFNILFAGRLSKEKNIDFILSVFESLKNKYPNEHMKLLIAGDGPLKAELIEIKNKMKHGNFVDFLGYCPDMKDIYSCADVMCLASSIEGFPVSLLEALDFKLPVVSSNCASGPSSIIGFGKNIKPNDSYVHETPVGFLLPVPTGDNSNAEIVSYVDAISKVFDKRFNYCTTFSNEIIEAFEQRKIFRKWESII